VKTQTESDVLSDSELARDWHWVQDAQKACWAYTDSTAPDRFTWTGTCKDRRIAGHGTLTWLKGDKPVAVETGLFAHGKLNGAGRIDDPAGAFLEGNFEDGKLEGAGRQKWTCGNLYEGTFHEGLPDGKGTYVFCNGARYSGGMRAGRIHGAGVWTMRDGAVVNAVFEDGAPVGTVTYRGANGVVLKGEMAFPHNDPAFPILPTTYPDDARRNDEQGRVWITFTVKADGSVRDVALEASSGYADLDQAALQAGPSWHLTPARVGATAIDFPTRRAVTFKLDAGP
jgi:TonB family protein